MYLIEVFFHCPQQDETKLSLINQIIDQWRYNGQIIGREIPLYFANQNELTGFGVKVICPEQHSLLPEWNNINVEQALAQAEKCGIILESLQIVADDLNSDSTYQEKDIDWQVLYTTHLHSCSPLHHGQSLQPIPLYKLCKNQPHLSMDLIKWQENWQAYDQLQMNAAGLEKLALEEMSDPQSQLSKHGITLAQELEKYTQTPTYYYLYRVGGNNLPQEQQRCCPSCGNQWKLNIPHDIFYFKCDQCRLVSNLSWSVQ